MELSGRSIIGFGEADAAGAVFRARNPVNSETLAPDFFSASPDDVNRVAQLASQAFARYSRVPGREKAEFLRRIAANVESVAEEIVERANLETALPKARLQSEAARTCNQLRLFADVVEEGS